MHAPDFNRAPTRLRRHLAADIIQVKIPAATAEFRTSGNSGCGYVAASGLNLGRVQVPRHIDDELIRAPAIAPARLRHHPRCVSFYRRADSIGLKFAAGVLF